MIIFWLIALVLTFSNFYGGHFSRAFTAPEGLRSAWLKTALLQGLLVTLSSELVSHFRWLNPGAIAAFWVGVVLLQAGVFWQFTRKAFSQGHALTARWQAYRRLWSTLDALSRFAVLGSVLLGGVGLTIALLAPPNNYDSLTYHLPRVMHWAQNHHLGFYPTHNLRQLALTPGASYWILQIYLLTGSDRGFNLIQWLAGGGCAIALSAIVGLWGNLQAQCLAVLVAMTVPMAILQSATTQTDLLTAFWVLTLAYFVLRRSSYSAHDLLWITLALGLASLTKPTGLLFSLPFLGILLGNWVRQPNSATPLLNRLGRGSLIILGILLLALSLSLPSYGRNYSLFRSLVVDFETRNTSFGLALLFSSVLKNVALSLPLEPFWRTCHWVHEVVLQVDWNDSRLTFMPLLPTEISPLMQRLWQADEDFVSQPLHWGLLMATAIRLLMVRPRSSLPREIRWLGLVQSVGFLLFCGALKWQIWGNRLLLPLTLLGVPLITYGICHYLPRQTQAIVASVLFFSGLFYNLTPVYRPILPLPGGVSHISAMPSVLQIQSVAQRHEYFFANVDEPDRASLNQLYRQVVEAIANSGCQSLGLAIGSNDLEYPLWAMLRDRGLKHVRIKHVLVDNISQQQPDEFADREICGIWQQKGSQVNYLSTQPRRSGQ